MGRVPYNQSEKNFPPFLPTPIEVDPANPDSSVQTNVDADGNATGLPEATAETRRAGQRLTDGEIARLTEAQLDFFGIDRKAKEIIKPSDPASKPSTIGDIPIVGEGQQGDIAIRGAAGWIILGAGTPGQVLKTNGTGANSSWADASKLEI